MQKQLASLATSEQASATQSDLDQAKLQMHQDFVQTQSHINDLQKQGASFSEDVGNVKKQLDGFETKAKSAQVQSKIEHQISALQAGVQLSATKRALNTLSVAMQKQLASLATSEQASATQSDLDQAKLQMHQDFVQTQSQINDLQKQGASFSGDVCNVKKQLDGFETEAKSAEVQSKIARQISALQAGVLLSATKRDLNTSSVAMLDTLSSAMQSQMAGTCVFKRPFISCPSGWKEVPMWFTYKPDPSHPFCYGVNYGVSESVTEDSGDGACVQDASGDWKADMYGCCNVHT